LKPVTKKEKPEEEKEEVKLKPVPKKERPEEKGEFKLKPVAKKEKPEEEKEEVKLKPVPRKEKPEEEKEEVKLKPIPRKEKPEEETEGVQLKPIQRKEKPEEETEGVQLKPIPRKEKPEEEKVEVRLKPVPKKEKPEEEKEVIELTTVLKKEEIVLKTIPGAVIVTDEMKPVETTEEKTVAPWRRKRAGKSEDIIPVPICEESKPELIPVQVEEEGEEYNEEKKSKTHITFSTVQKKVSLRPKQELPSDESQEVVEVRETWQKEMRMDAVSKKKVTHDERMSIIEAEGRPLRELEIVTAKRVTEGVICVPEEPVVEDVEVHEERHTVKHSLLQETKAIPQIGRAHV
jgi:hypothetical protein